MSDHDIHLASTSISPESRSHFEKLGFIEDLFFECQNCTPTLYHATYRGDPARLSDDFWKTLCTTLTADPQFNGILEEETLIRSRRNDPRASVDPGMPPA